MDLNKKLEELKPYQLNCNVFDVYSYNGLTMQDLLCQFFTKINECITVSNETIDLAKWLVNEGLEIEVVKKLMLWLEDGTLENIINVNIFNTLNEKINVLKLREVNIIEFGGDPTGQKDSSIALQNAINSLNDTANSSYKSKGGRVKVPQGNYKLENSILLKSQIELVGDGLGITNFIPKIDGGFIFYTDIPNDGSSCVNLHLRDFSIVDETLERWGGTFGNKYNRPNIGGIKLSHCFSCSMTRVGIYNLRKQAYVFEQVMDTYLTDCEFQMCGSESVPMVEYLSGYTDLTNAIHVNNCRFENGGYLSIGDDIRPQRELYFNNTKFENIHIKVFGVNNLNFNNSTFTGNNDVNDGYIFSAIKSNTGNNNITFSSCIYQSGKPNVKRGLDLRNVLSCKVVNCSFDLMFQSILADNTTIGLLINNNNFTRCNTPLISVKDNVNILNNNVIYASGSDYTIKFKDNCNVQGNRLISNVTDEENGLYGEISNYVCNNFISEGFKKQITLNGIGNIIQDNFCTTIEADTLNNKKQKNMSTNITSWGGENIGDIKLDGDVVVVTGETEPFFLQGVFFGDVRPVKKVFGTIFFDTNINKPIFWEGNKWIFFDGTDA